MAQAKKQQVEETVEEVQASTGQVDHQDTIPVPTAEDLINHADDYKGWIKMSHEQMVAAQEQGILCGYHPLKGLGLVNKKETKKQ